LLNTYFFITFVPETMIKKMPRILIAIILLLLSWPGFSQSDVFRQPLLSADDQRVAQILRSNLSDQYSNSWNVGSAKKLEGRVYLLEVWLTETGTQWNYNEMCTLQSHINEATGWMERLAAQYGKSVEFVCGTYAGDSYKGIQMRGLPRSYAEAAENTQLLTKALQIIGYYDNMQCYKALCDDYDCQGVLVLVMINNPGWSCANNFSVGHAMYGYENYFLENAYIFTKSAGVPTSSQVIAHEMMHMFGAWDMYGGQVSEQAGQWASQNYPNEIMLQVSSPLSRMYVSPLNAWLTGLSNDYKSWYMWFQRREDATVDE